MNTSTIEDIDIHEMGPNNQHVIFWRIEQNDFGDANAFWGAGVDINVRRFMDMPLAIWALSVDRCVF